MTDNERFGQNGAVTAQMSPELREEYKTAEREGRWLPAKIVVLIAATVLLVVAIETWAPSPSDDSLSWYDLPELLWWAWMTSLVLPLPFAIGHALRRRLRGDPDFRWFGAPTELDRAVRTLPLGVLLAAACDAIFQYRAAADAALLLP